MAFLLSADVQELLVSYLSTQLINVPISTKMPPNPTYPFVLINRISGGDDMVTDMGTVSIHSFQTGPTPEAAETAANTLSRQVHLAMKQLVPSVAVLMSNGTYASIDSMHVVESPRWEDYGDKQIQRYVARYHVDVRCNLTT